MMKQIKIFNVNFGDCFLCESEEENKAAMLVDFGSTRSIVDCVADEVNSSLRKFENKYLMISHFHSDHYSGIHRLDDDIIFNEVYLPNFFTDDVIRLQLVVLAVLSESNPAHGVALNLLSVVPDLLNHLNNFSRICYVKRKEKIFNQVDSCRILWPDINDFNDEAKEIFNKLVDYYGLSVKLGQFNDLVASYINLFPTIDNNEGFYMQFNDEYLAESQHYKQEAENIKNKVIELFKEDKISVKRIDREINKQLSSFQNEISICFDNVADEGGVTTKSVLFLSDISRDNYYKIANATDGLKIAGEYKAIKVAHHGTKGYFVNNLPKSEYLIISNGNASNDSWRITSLYGWNYSDSTFICTNYTNACDYEFACKKCDAYNKNGGVCGINLPNVVYDLLL